MPSSTRKARRLSAAAAAESDEEGSVTSRGSRSSARLKRKREQQHRNSLAVEPVPEEGAAAESPDGEAQQQQSPASKRRRVKSAQKKTPAPKEPEDDDDDDESRVPMEIETSTKTDNGDEEEEEEEDAKLPAAPTNGHGVRNHHESGTAAAAAAMLTMNNTEEVNGTPQAAAASATTTTTTASKKPPLSQRRGSRPASSSKQPKQRTPASAREEEEMPSAATTTTASATRQQQSEPEEPAVHAPPPNNGDLPPEEHQLQWSVQQYVVERVGRPTFAYLRAQTTTYVVPYVARAADVIEERWRRGGGAAEYEVEEIIEEVVVGAAVEEDDEAGQQPPKSSPWERTLVWFLLFLLLQMVFFPLWLNPILSTTVSASRVVLSLYQSLLVAPSIGGYSSSSGPVDLESRIRERMLAMEKLQQELHASTDVREQARQKLGEATEALQGTVAEQLQSFEQASRDDSLVVKNLKQLVELEGDDFAKSPHLPVVLALLKNSSGATTSISFVDTSRVELWSVSEDDSAACADTEDALDRAKFDEALEMIHSEAKDAVVSIQHEPDMIAAVQSWIRHTFRAETGMDGSDSGSVRSTVSTTSNQNKAGRVRQAIAERLELESADQTGIFDYASILNGAWVIRSKTSPSLIDNLPMINRMAAFWGLRFYGHGPEAALTPTHPPNALGQCWSFEHQQEDAAAAATTTTSDPAFGVLTVRLANPIYVDSVLIEHPPKEIAGPGAHSAIRSFRVQGFEDENASGDVWELGSFEYSIPRGGGVGGGGGRSRRQEFSVDDTVDGESVPVLHAIRLVVESNWGGPYACLYRLRVHGVEEREEGERREDGESETEEEDLEDEPFEDDDDGYDDDEWEEEEEEEEEESAR